MVSRLSTTLLVLSLLVLATCDSTDITQYESSYTEAKSQGTVTVTDYSSIKSFAVGAWVRPSQTIKSYFPWSNLSSTSSLIMGASSSKSGLANSSINNGDCFIQVLLSKWGDGSGFILRYDNDGAFSFLRVDVDFDKLFGRWFYVYSAYHSDLKKHYLAVYNSYSTKWVSAWSDKVVKNTISRSFKFSVGASDAKTFNQFNGYVYGVSYSYLASDTYYVSSDDLTTFLKTFTQPTYIGITSKKVFTFYSSNKLTAAGYNSTSLYPGADEYSVTGTFQFSSAPSVNSVSLIYRLSTNAKNDTATSYIGGDRTFHAYVENNRICFYSYFFSQTLSYQDNIQCFSTAPVVTNTLYYFYQGYSRTQRKTFSYLRVQDTDYYVLKNDVLHVDPYAFYVFVAGDNIQKTVPGVYTLNLEVGPGAYRETFITKIPSFDPVDNIPAVVIPSTYVAPTVSSSSQSNFKSLDVRPVKADYISALTGFAIHFWIRRDINQPTYSDLTSARLYQSIAGVTYNSAYNYGNNFFAVHYVSHSQSDTPAYEFLVNLDGVINTKTVASNILQDQGQWHWVYFAYNKTLNQATYAVDFGNGPTLNVIDKVVSPTINSLQAILGSDGVINYPAVSGEFYDFQFMYDAGRYVNNQKDLNAYIATNRSNPPSRVAPSQVYQYDPANAVVANVTADQIAYATSYAITGWAKWNHTQSFNNKGNVLFALSINDPVTASNPARLGDHTLEIVVKKTSVTFNTYQLGYTNNQDKQVTSKTVQIDYLAGQWCLYYFGYDRNEQAAYGSVSCDSGYSGSVKFENIDHIIPSKGYYYLTKSYDYESFVGLVYKPYLIINNGVLHGVNYPSVVTDDRPEKDNCAVIFSDCDYETEIQTICENVPELDLADIMSIYVPQGYSLRFYRQKNYKGLNIKFIDSVSCLDQTLTQQPDLEWQKLQSLFNAGKITFTNSNGDDISLSEAQSLFFNQEDLTTSTPSLRRTHKRNNQQSLAL